MPNVNKISITGYIRAPERLRGSLTEHQSLSGRITIPEQVDAQYFDGAYEYTPTWEDQILPTQRKTMRSNVVFKEIQTYETSNEAGGITFVI